jgi:hypothetical protein
MPRPFERPTERTTLRFHLQKGRSILMLAPRRIGKTWLLQRLAEDLQKDGVAILCSAEGMTSEAQFLEALCKKIEDAAKIHGAAVGRLKQLWDNVRTQDLSQGWKKVLRTDWKAFASTLIARMAAQDQATVILVDELALFVLALQKRDPDAAHAFLYHLRALRQQHPKVRWVFTGSIGLDVVARRTEIEGALVDLQAFTLDPLSADEAAAFLDHLSSNGQIMHPFDLDADGMAHLAAELGWLAPYYIERVAHEMRLSGANTASGRPLATPGDLDAAFARLLAPDRRIYFATWREHLEKNFPPEEVAQLRLILDACAATAAGELLDTLQAMLSGPPHALSLPTLRDRLTALVNNAFLVEAAQDDRTRFRFRSGLLRRYWLRYEAA